MSDIASRVELSRLYRFEPCQSKGEGRGGGDELTSPPRLEPVSRASPHPLGHSLSCQLKGGGGEEGISCDEECVMKSVMKSV